jgi:hypothetical protein
MPTPAAFLKDLGERLAAFDPPRVAKIGCLTSIGLALLVIAGGVAGIVEPQPIFPRFFRIIVLTVLGSALVIFAIFAGAETLAERRARRQIETFLSSGGVDLATLREMAAARKGRFAGSEQVIELLERMASK